MNQIEEQDSDNQPITKSAKTRAENPFVKQLFSPAMGLAVLGTFALIFSFYRAGQLTNLVVSKDEIKQVATNASSFRKRPKIDINSEAIVSAADNSQASMFVMSGEYKKAVDQAFKDLTDNPSDYLPTILEAGDVLSQFGNDKELGFGLLERAVALAPNNQYIALRYAQRFMSSNRSEEAQAKLTNLAQKYPNWPDVQIVLSKLHYLQNQKPLAITEFVHIASDKNLNSRQSEQVALMLAKLGREADGFAIFQQAASGEPAKCFYANYCQDWLNQSPESYQTVLAMVKTNLANNTNSAKQLNLEIKHAALLLLLGRPQDAQATLQQSINAHSNSFDLQILLAASHVAQGQSEQGIPAFKNAVKYYQPKF